MSRPRLRALIATLASASLMLFLLAPAGALAGRATRGSDHLVRVTCDFLESDEGTLFFGATISRVNGAEAGLDFFGPGDEPFVDQFTYTSNFDEAPAGTFDGAAFAGGEFTFESPVVDDTFTPAGSAVIEATLVPSGDVEPFDDRFRDGNHWNRSKGLFMPYEIVDGTATLPDGSTFAGFSDVTDLRRLEFALGERAAGFSDQQCA